VNHLAPPARLPLSRRAAPWAWSLLCGLAAVLVTSLVCAPATGPQGPMGQANLDLAANPFAATANPMATRFLAPLLAWLLGLRGNGFLLLLAGICVLLPAAGARWALARGHGLTGAALAAGVLGLTLLTRVTWHYGGMTDALSYLLLFGAWALRARPRAVAALLLLALFTNERALFLWPFFAWLLARDAGHPPRTTALTLLIPVLLWAPVYAAILSVREVEHTPAYYAAPLLADPLDAVRRAWPRQPLGFLSAFQWLWLLPLIDVFRRRTPWPALALPLLAAAAQMLIAYDSSRMAALAFPMLLPALDRGLTAGGLRFRRLLAALLVLQALTPQLYTAAHAVEIPRGWLWP